MKKSPFSSQTKVNQNPEHKNSESNSHKHRIEIIRETERARLCSQFAFLPPYLSEVKALGEVLVSARKMLMKYKDEMFGEHKQECFERILAIQKIHDSWWEELEHNKSRKLELFEISIRKNFEKNRVRYVMATNALRRLHRNVDILREKIVSVKDDDFRYQVSEWLSNTESCIDNTERYMRTLEERIERDEEKLRQR
jgi:hypothetical protein